MFMNGYQRLQPPNLLEQASSPDRPKDFVWWIVNTLPRQEKATAKALEANNIAFYLPTIQRKSLSKGRRRVAEVVLFPGYVFAFGNEDVRSIALRTNRSVAVRRAPNHDELTAQLIRFKELIDINAPLLPEARIVSGERVRVKSGPFRGQEGVAIRRNGRSRLLIAIDYLQQGASLEVDDSVLEGTGHIESSSSDRTVLESEVSPPAIVIAWSPEQVSDNDYAQLVAAIGDIVRLEGGNGIRRLQSLGFELPVASGVGI